MKTKLLFIMLFSLILINLASSTLYIIDDPYLWGNAPSWNGRYTTNATGWYNGSSYIINYTAPAYYNLSVSDLFFWGSCAGSGGVPTSGVIGRFYLKNNSIYNTLVEVNCYGGDAENPTNYPYTYHLSYPYPNIGVSKIQIIPSTAYPTTPWIKNVYILLVNISNITSISYNTSTYSGSTEYFNMNLTYPSSDYTGLSAKLFYDGSWYPASITGTGDNISASTSIIAPSVIVNTNKSFLWQVGLTNALGTYYFNSTWYNQTVKYTAFGICNSTATNIILNFTFYDEANHAKLNTSWGNTTSIQASFIYGGSGYGYFNYSFQNFSSTVTNYLFCNNQPDNNLAVTMDMVFSAINYGENYYTLNNAQLTNTTSNIYLYLLPTASATKFQLTFKKGVNILPNYVVTIQKYFIGEGIYKTTSIIRTDSTGKASVYLDLDGQYRYSITSPSGTFIGQKDQNALCTTAPCEQTIYITDSLGNAYDSYNAMYANGTISSITYNKTTHIVTYNFLDTTGLAKYFRLQVDKVYYNQSGGTICDTQSASSAGSLTCNLTGYSGDFTAKGYISRSPEKVDSVLSIFTAEDVVESLGLMGLFLSMCLIVMVLFATAAISKGNPSTILYGLMAVILLEKLITIFPFNWTVTACIELLIFFITTKVKT